MTSTGVGVHVLITNSAVLTGSRLTLVDVDSTVFPAESVDTEAGVVANSVEASSPVLTWEGSTVVGVDDAVASFVAFGTSAVVGAVGVSAGSAVSAWGCHDTLVDVLVAETTGVADGAGAGKVQEV